MKPFVILFILCSMVTLSSCGNKVNVDTSKDPASQASALTAEMTPQQLGAALVEWMSKAQPEDREYVRNLTREIMSIYDHNDNYASRHFAHAIDSMKETLSVERLARVYVVASQPARLAAVLKSEGADSVLIREIRKAYGADSIGLKAFDTNYFTR